MMRLTFVAKRDTKNYTVYEEAEAKGLANRLYLPKGLPQTVVVVAYSTDEAPK